MLRGLTALVIAAALALVIPGAAHADGESDTDYVFPGSAATHFYDLSFTRHWNVPQGTPYITVLNDSDVLALDWDFEVARIRVDNGETVRLAPLAIPAGARVLDLVKVDELPQSAASTTVLVSYSYDDGSGACTRLVARQAKIDLNSGGASTLGRIWYQSPCMRVDIALEPSPLAMSGGRIAVVPKAWRANAKQLELFMSVGDFHIAKSERAAKLPASMRGQVNSIVRISAPLKSSVYAKGFRNVHGLTIATVNGTSELLAAEHGPRGGDEINIVKKGVDYGWPSVSYGTVYGPGRTSDTPGKAGTHAGYPYPLFAWVPAVAPTSVIQIKGPTFSRWWKNSATKAEGDLLVSAMGAQHLIRMRVDGGAVRYVENIWIGARVRTLVQMPSGVIVAGIDQGSDLIVIQPTSMWTVLK